MFCISLYCRCITLLFIVVTVFTLISIAAVNRSMWHEPVLLPSLLLQFIWVSLTSVVFCPCIFPHTQLHSPFLSLSPLPSSPPRWRRRRFLLPISLFVLVFRVFHSAMCRMGKPVVFRMNLPIEGKRDREFQAYSNNVSLLMGVRTIRDSLAH